MREALERKIREMAIRAELHDLGHAFEDRPLGSTEVAAMRYGAKTIIDLLLPFVEITQMMVDAESEDALDDNGKSYPWEKVLIYHEDMGKAYKALSDLRKKLGEAKE